jgi:hypothetical protein
VGLREFNLARNKKGFDKLLGTLLGVESDVFVVFRPSFE